jgi:2-hydroxychromene-2-carboxylate isomerase
MSECKNKLRYAGVDLARWSKRYGVGVRQNPHLREVDTAQLLRGALIASDDGHAEPYVSTVFGALWNGERDLGQATEVIALLNHAGLDGVKLLERAASADVVARLDEATAAAAERGLFGSPSFIVGGELFFGNDRLDFVAAALAAQPA